MRVLADLHHAELYYSLQLLFEKRLGWELYRPIGIDWYEQGYWHVFPHLNTANQFLGLNQAIEIPKDFRGNPLPRGFCINEEYIFEDGIYYVKDPTKNKVNRGITLEKFKEMDFDILISSIPQHIEPFNKLIRKFQPRAKHVFQVGNSWGHLPGIKNVLASTSRFAVPAGLNICFYHQEFDLEMFRYQSPDPSSQKKICSYIHYMKGMDLFAQYAHKLPKFQFLTYGAGMLDSLMETQLLADQMRNSTFTWHYKPEGDGFGHVIHNTFAVGRPSLVWKPHYAGRLAETLMVDGQTCLDLSCRNFEANIRAISRASEPAEHARMCKAAKKRFDSIVNFDDQFENQIKPFLERLR